MKTLKKFIFSLCALLPLALLSQEITVSGYVSDYNTGEKLIYANVFVLGEEIGTTTTAYGYYSITLKKQDTMQIVFSYMGYKSDTILIKNRNNQQRNVKLKSGKLLKEVVVTDLRTTPINQHLEIGIINISTAQISQLPALGGESDLLKALQLMPGVQAGQEGTSGMYVRGGTPDQNLILLDGTPLYHINHLGGFVSTFNTDAINQAKMTKGGFPATLGGRISSILDVRMKDGNSNKFHGYGMLGMVTSKLAIEGPIKKDSSSFLVSYRRFLYDIFLSPLTRKVMDNQQLGYNFYDFNAKINYRFSDKNQVFFSLYSGQDKIAITQYKENMKDDDGVDFTNSWGNHLAALRWNHIFTPKHFVNFQLAYTKYKYKLGIGTYLANENHYDFYYEYNSSIEDFLLKSNFNYTPKHYYTLNYGISSIHHSLSPASVYQHVNADYYNSSSTHGQMIIAWDNALYIDNQLKIGQSLKGNIGLRYSNYLIENNEFHFLEPRLLLSYKLNNQSAMRFSLDKMHQNVHLLTSNGMGLPADIWFPATNNIAPETSRQLSASYVQNLEQLKMEFSIEGFYRQMKELIEYKEGYSHLSNTQNWEQNIESGGKGTAYGVELLLQKKSGRLNGWLAYTWSKNQRQFDHINFGEIFPYRYDRRHSFNLILNYQFNEEISFSANWVYGSGNPFTPPSGIYYTPVDDNFMNNQSEGETFNYQAQAYIYAERNSGRMKDYHRLDLSAQFTKEKKWGHRTWSIGIYNFYNRKNPYYYNIIWEPERDIYGAEIEGTKKMKIEQKSLFPFIPSVSYSFSF